MKRLFRYLRLISLKQWDGFRVKTIDEMNIALSASGINGMVA